MAEGLPFRIDLIDGVYVVRDDLVPGGTKARVLPRILEPGVEYVYASPAYGYAQIALALSAASVGAQATVFVAARTVRHPRTQAAADAGAAIHEVRPGYLSVVEARARRHCILNGSQYLPFGIALPQFSAALVATLQTVPLPPDVSSVWVVAGSGTLARAMREAWPSLPIHAVRVGAAAVVPGATLYAAPERYEQRAAILPPFPSCDNYDAKVWRYVRNASRGAGRPLMWNVAG